MQNLVKQRNTLLHASWYIGWHLQDEDISTIHSLVLKPGAAGVKGGAAVEDLAELRRLRNKIEELDDLLTSLSGNCVMRQFSRQMGGRTSGRYFSRRMVVGWCITKPPDRNSGAPIERGGTQVPLTGERGPLIPCPHGVGAL